MTAIKTLRDRFANKTLKRDLLSVRRQKKLSNFKTASKAGVLFYSVDQFTFKLVNEFVNYLNYNNIEAFPLIIVDNEKLIDHYLYRKGFIFITKNDINWLQVPKGTDVDNFINSPYDILFNLSIDDYFPITYIQGLSKAKMKVGKLMEETEALDIGFDLTKEKQAQLELKNEIKNEKRKKIRKKNLGIEAEIEKKIDREIEIDFLIEEIKRYVGMFDKYITFHPTL
jgi:hypothetical protein